MNEKSLFLENGMEIKTEEELINYVKVSQNILNEIRTTPEFALEFRNGNLENYYKIEESLKLKTNEGKILDFDEALDYFREYNTDKKI